MSQARLQFLQNEWISYPEAQDSWIDVADFKRGVHSFGTGDHQNERSTYRTEGEFLVCGRLSLYEANFILSSGGSTLKFSFEPKAFWLGVKSANLPLEPAQLEEGDLLGLRLSGSPKDSGDPEFNFLASAVLLLVPTAPAIVAGSTTAALPMEKFDVRLARQWVRFLGEVRAYFEQQDFIEVRTPTLVPSPGTEPFLDPFLTHWHFGSREEVFYLPTSPEFHLKKLLVRGWTKIFEFKTCFRNGEIGPHHQAEFLLLEWYRAYANLDRIADDVERLFVHLMKVFGRPSSPSGLRVQRVSMPELFHKNFAGFELKPTTSLNELRILAKKEGVQVAEDDSWDEVFFRIFLEKIEGNLGADEPVLLRGYPPSQAALSRLGPDGFADRFEVYWKGVELANAFHELNDATENEKRFANDQKLKLALGKPAVPVDQELIKALHYGMPPSGGIALGLERLFMVLFDLKSLENCRAFYLT